MKRTRKEMTLYCLEKYPETRNNDVLLTIKIWETYYYKEMEMLDGYLHKLYEDKDVTYPLPKILAGFMQSVPNEDDVKRVRAIIQNQENKFLPTDPEVIKQRQMKEANWQERI